MIISPAFAQATAGAASSQDMFGQLGQIPLLIAMFAVMYFLMIRPQMKKAKEHKALIAGLQKGDEVITQGGLAGKVTQLSDNYVKIDISANSTPVEVTVQRPAIGLVLPKGSLSTLS